MKEVDKEGDGHITYFKLYDCMQEALQKDAQISNYLKREKEKSEGYYLAQGQGGAQR